MGCLQLRYQTTETPLKVAYRKPSSSENIAQRFLSVDPLAHEFASWSPYAAFKANPIYYIDPDGRAAVPPDWVQGADGNVKWDKDANSQETTKAGEKYLGKTLTFTFNSYIDPKLWDRWQFSCRG